MDISGGTRAAVVFAVLMATSMVAMPALAGGSTSSGAEASDAGTGLGTDASSSGAAFQTTAQDSDGTGDTAGTTNDTDGPTNGTDGPAATDDVPLASNVGANSSVDAIRTARIVVDGLDVADETAREAANDSVASMDAALDAFRQPNAADEAAAFEHLLDAQVALGDFAAATDEHDDTVGYASALLFDASTVSSRLATIEGDRTLDAFEDDLAAADRLADAEGAREASFDARADADDAALEGAAFAADVDAPQVVETGAAPTLNVTVTNVGAMADAAAIAVSVGNQTREERTVELEPDERWTQSYDVDASEPERVAFAVETPDHERTSAIDVVEERFTFAGYEPQPIHGTEQYYDVTGSGAVTFQDLQAFFEHQHRSPVDDRPDLFDFTGNGEVGQPDVIRLFEVIGSTDEFYAAPPSDYDLDALLESRADATDHQRAAWEHGESVLEHAEASSSPTLELEQGAAHERNGTVLVPVRATVTDVRPERYANASVTTADGTALDPIALYADGTLSKDASGSTVVDLGPDAENRTVTVEAAVDGDRTVSETLEIVVEDEDVLPEQPAPDEYNEAAVEDEETGVEVEAGGDGLWEPDLSVENASAGDPDAGYRAGPMVRIENETAIDDATVRLPVDDEEPSEVANHSIYTWEPDNGGWERLETDVDFENGTASADVEHFSYFAVFDEQEWEERRTETITLEEEHFDTDSNTSYMSPGEKLWEFDKASDSVYSSPTIAHGSVYVGSNDGKLYAIDATTGELEWEYQSPNRISTSPVVMDGTVFAASRGGTTFAVDAETGGEEWKTTEVTDRSSPWITAANNTVFVTASEDNSAEDLYGINATTGNVDWTFGSSGYRVTSYPVVSDDSVYFVSRQGDLYSVDINSGEENWRYTTAASHVSESPVVSNGVVYFNTGRSLFAVNISTQNKEWRYTEERVGTSPTVSDGTVYVGTSYRNVAHNFIRYHVDAISSDTGDRKWQSRSPDDTLRGSPTVAGDTLYFGTRGDRIYSINATTGDHKWTFDEPSGTVRSPTVADGVLFAGSYDNTVYAVATDHDASSENTRVRSGPYGKVGDVARDEDVQIRDPLRDSTDDGIPDAVADANPAIPHLLPFESEDDARVDLDPYFADTSGDGISDAEQIDVEYRVFEEDGETKLETWIEDAVAHPNRTDTTGDGLTDREQLEGWAIQVVDDHDDAQALEEAVESGETGPELLEYFEPREVTANSLVEDTAGNGLSDVEERRLGTDPRTDDTTGDGITDLRAVNRYDHYEDPTIFTTSGPRIGLTDYDSGWASDPFEITRYRFTYQYQLEDGAGVDRAQLVQNEKDGPLNTYDGQRIVHEHDEITTEADGLLQYSRGLDAEITAWDTYGNERSELFVVQRSLGPILLQEYDWMDDPEAGLLSGWTHGAAEIPDLALLLYRSPRETLEALGGVGRELATTKVDGDPTSEGEFWIELGQNMAEATHLQQDLDNPNDAPVEDPDGYWDACLEEYRNYDEPPTAYCEYATGWYQGYALFAAIDIVIGSRGSVKAADGVDDLADAAQTASRQADDVNWAAALDEPGTKTTQVNQRMVADGGRYTDELSGQLDSAGKQAQQVDRVRKVDHEILSELDRAQRTELYAHLADSPHGHQLVNDLGPGQTRQLLASNANVGQVFQKHGELPAHQQNRFANLLRDEDLGQSWLRVVSDEDIPAGEVSRAIARTNEVSAFGRVTDFQTGNQVQRSEYPEDWAQVHTADSIVTEFTLTEQTTVYRLYTEGTQQNPWGHFTMRSESDITRMSPEQLQGKYALPNQPPNAVARGEIPEGTTMRTGEVAPNEFGDGRGTQYTLPESHVGDVDPSWFEKSDGLTEALVD